MELRKLRHFVAVAEEGNISRAAQKVFLTQPALSRQIKALEEELGQCLFERQPHSIRLTPAGERLLREAPGLLAQADQVMQRVREAGRERKLRVGYAPSLAVGILSSAVTHFTQVHPNTRVELSDLSTTELLSGLENRQLDVVVTVNRHGVTRGIHWVPLTREPWQLAVKRNHPLARRVPLSMAEVAGEPLLIFRQEDYPEYWEFIGGWLRTYRQRPNLAGEYDGADSLMAAVEAGLGVAVVTARLARLYPGRVQMCSLSTPPEPLCIAAGLRDDRKDEPLLAVLVRELQRAGETFAKTAPISRSEAPKSRRNPRRN